MARQSRTRSALPLVLMLVLGAVVWVPQLAFGNDSLDASFGPSQDIWIDRDRLRSLPTSGPAWDALAAEANSSWGAALVSDQDNQHDVATFAGALYAVRMNDVKMRERVVLAIEGAVDSEAGGRTLALARNLTGYVLAADLIGYRSDRFVNWLKQVRTRDLDGRTLVSTHNDRPNNWGTHAGAARIATDIYLGDTTDLQAAAKVFRGFLGDRSAYAGFNFGDDEWQHDPSSPVPINPAGTKKNGYVVDGAIVDDVRRCECPVSNPAPKENYQWEGMQGIVTQATLLRRAGYHDVWYWSDRAIQRAVEFLYQQADFPAEGDDAFLPFLIDAGLGTDYSAGVTARSGKSIGFTDWTHARSDLSTTPPPPPPSSSTTTTTAPTTSSSTTTTTTSTTTSTTTTTAPPTTSSTTSTTTTSTTSTSSTTSTTSSTTTTTSPTPGPVTRTATSEVAVAGTVSGALDATWKRDGVLERLRETTSSGRPQNRYDLAEHRWAIPAAPGNQQLHFAVRSDADAGDLDRGFWLEWSADGTVWTPVVLVQPGATVDAVTDIGPAPGNTVWVRLVDTDRTGGQTAFDGIGVDLLAVVGDGKTDVERTAVHEVVASIAVGEQPGRQGAKHGTATVSVTDPSGSPVDGAIVTVQFTGDIGETVVGMTGANGTVTLTSFDSVKRLSVSACVSAVAVPEPLVYVPGSESCSGN